MAHNHDTFKTACGPDCPGRNAHAKEPRFVFPPALASVVTYEVWEQETGKEPYRRHERGYSDPRAPQRIADGYNDEQVWLDRYEPDHTKPTRRFFVVRATTAFEEVERT
jgi:hypothetical protein